MNEQVKTIVTEETVASAAPATKKHMSIGQKIATTLSVCAVAACMALSVGATGGETSQATTADLQSTMTTSFSTVKDDIINTSGAVLPYGLGVFGVGFCVKKGMKFFKNVSN